MAHADLVANCGVKTIRSQPFIWGITTAVIKCTQWTSRDVWQHLSHTMKIERCALRDTSSSHTMWQNLNAPSIRQMGLNRDNLYSSISSEPLIKDEETNQMVTPKCCLFIPTFFDGKNIFGYFEQSNCLNISILESLAFLSAKLISPCEEGEFESKILLRQ